MSADIAAPGAGDDRIETGHRFLESGDYESAKKHFDEALTNDFSMPTLCSDNFQSLERGRDLHTRQSGREHKGSSDMFHEVDDLFLAAHKSTERSKRLRKGPENQIDITLESKAFSRTPAVGTQYSGGVGIVQHHSGTVFLCQLDDLG